MDQKSMKPLDTGPRIRSERRKRCAHRVRRVLRNRRVLLVVLWVAKAIVELARLISQVFYGS